MTGVKSDTLSLEKRTGLPDALRVLAQDFPRDMWREHPNFAGLVQFWMQRHMMFRELTGRLRDDARKLSDKRIDFADYAPRLSRYGSTLLNELHGHHQIEDHHYFPHLVGLDNRISRGFDLLETDHEAMDGLLHELAERANQVLKTGKPGDFHERLGHFSALLERHLTDEEDIVVPVILKSGFTG
jgi:iron-sulfur cluster repair protein YtfE (RIC family)